MNETQNLLNRKSMRYTLEKMLIDREYCGATECLECLVNSGGHTVAVQDTIGTSKFLMSGEPVPTHVGSSCLYLLSQNYKIHQIGMDPTGGFLVNLLLKTTCEI